MTLTQLQGQKVILGARAFYCINKLVVNVTIQDVRQAWGRTDALIVPCDGSGSVWVDIGSLKMLDKVSETV